MSRILRLLDHHHWLWRRFADYYVDACTWEELSRNHETSHHTIANVTMHAVNMEDWWLHYVWPGKAWDGPRWDGFTSAEAMRARIHEVEAKTRRLLDGVAEKGLEARRRVRPGEEEVEVSLGDALAEVLVEAAHHRGEVLAMLWRMDKEPPYAGFIEHLQEATPDPTER